MTSRRAVATPLAVVILLVVPTLAGCGPRAPEEPPPDVLLITVDTLRADRLGSYGYQPAETPTLDALAASGVRFTAATVPIPRTTPALASLLTGLEPHHHGSREVGRPIHDPVPTLAETLADHGYRALAVSASGAASPAQGLGRGFHHFERVDENQPQPARETTEVALGLVRQARGEHPDAPLFLWVHYVDPHAPYQPPPAWADDPRGRACLDYLEFIRQRGWQGGHVFSDREGRSAAALESCSFLYDGEVAFTDEQIGRLLDGLEEHLRGEPLVVFTADHGENLGEDGLWYQHGPSLHDASLRVPLIVAGPGIHQNRVDDRPARSQDLFPTLLELAGLTAENGEDDAGAKSGEIDGGSLAGRLHSGRGWIGRRDTAPEVAFAEGGSALMEHNFPWLHSGAAGAFHCLNVTRWSLCEAPGEPPRLYDHEADPDLAHDLGPEHPEVVRRMLDARAHWPPEEARLRAVRTSRFKLVERPLPSGERVRALLDLETDPGEGRDVSTRFPEARRDLDALLNGWIAELPRPAPLERSDEEIERLRALGYLR